jgi:hypothetical protein
MDFLLSLSSTSKEKLSTIKQPNKSVVYLDQQLSEEDVSKVANADIPSMQNSLQSA